MEIIYFFIIIARNAVEIIQIDVNSCKIHGCQSNLSNSVEKQNSYTLKKKLKCSLSRVNWKN